MSFQKLGLAPELLSALEEAGYLTPTSIQTLAIPQILKGVDVIAGAQTGTGKTAAFTLPLLQRLMDDDHPERAHTTKVLILTPTRELACQVHQSVEKYSKNLSLCSVVLYGGVSFDTQVRHLEAGADIVVATPGRLMDHLEKGHIKLNHIRYLVIDEADRMLDMGFILDIRKIMMKLPRNRQTLFFSATFTDDVKALAKALLKSPVTIQAEKPNSAAAKVSHIVHPVDVDKKRQLLSYLIGYNRWKQVLIFTRTKVSADHLSRELTLDGIKNKAIHSDYTQGHRTKALSQFKEGQITALVATDVASRGIDIENLPCVINYELPNIPEDYIHRIGRTGRAGLEGQAITLVTEREVYRLDAIEKLLKIKLEQHIVAGFEPLHFNPQAVARDIKRQQREKAQSHFKHSRPPSGEASQNRSPTARDSRSKTAKDRRSNAERASKDNAKRGPHKESSRRKPRSR